MNYDAQPKFLVMFVALLTLGLSACQPRESAASKKATETLVISVTHEPDGMRVTARKERSEIEVTRHQETGQELAVKQRTSQENLPVLFVPNGERKASVEVSGQSEVQKFTVENSDHGFIVTLEESAPSK